MKKASFLFDKDFSLNKATCSGGRTFFFVLVFLYFASSAHISMGKELGAGLSLAREGSLVDVAAKDGRRKDVFQRLSSLQNRWDDAKVKTIQENLKILGYDSVEVTGLLTSKTLLAMEEFRDDFKITIKIFSSDQMVETLEQYADLLKKHPDWKATLSSDAFNKWQSTHALKGSQKPSGLSPPESALEISARLDLYKEENIERDQDARSQELQAEGLQVKHEALEKKGLPKALVNKSTIQSVPLEEALIKKEALPNQGLQKKPSAVIHMEEKPNAVVSPKDAADKPEVTSEPVSHEIEVSTEPLPLETLPPDLAQDVSAVAPILSILSQVKGSPPFSPEKQIQWQGGSCGCVADFSGIVYGFYPYWFSSEEQEVDFSLLSRIGYHALSFDQKGKVRPLRHWNPKTASFISEAQKHQTQVDVVIYKNDWKEWLEISVKDRLFIINETTTNIVAVVDQKISEPGALNIKTLVASESSTKMGDGVTLFFDDYPENPKAVQFFLDFVKTLRKKLKATGEHYYLNLMLPVKAIGQGVYTYQNLEEFMNKEETDADDEIDLYLVILEDEEADRAGIEKDKPLAPKKVLRAQIEKEFSGIKRRNMLRKIVPVIRPVGNKSEQYQQFEDDLIYFEDNFGGVGFWPLPLVGAADTEAVNAKIKTVFKKETGLGFLAKSLPINDTDYCNFVCPNRWIFRLVYDALFGLFLLYALIATRSALFRKLFEKYRIYFMGLGGSALLVFYSALMCDPYLSDKKAWAILALLLGSIFYWVLKTYSKMKQEAYP